MLAIDINVFRTAVKDINFDVFLQLSESNFVHVFSKITGLDYKRLAQYRQKGVTHLHIKSEDLETYRDFLAKPAAAILRDPNVSHEKRVATLLNMTEQNMAELFSQLYVEEETAVNTSHLVKNYVELMSTNPDTLVVLLKLVSHGEYLYYHSVAVSILSIMMSKASGQFDQNTLESIGLGGFLHDIGWTQLPREIFLSSEALTDLEWKEVKCHPGIGLKMLEQTVTVPKESKYIIYQHHEEPGGRGYPNGLRDKVIYHPAKFVSLADGFSALISKRPFRPAYTVEQALRIITNTRGKYDPDLVRLSVTLFARGINKAPHKRSAA